MKRGSLKKIAITGVDGFLGRYLCQLLRNKNISFVSFDRNKHNLFKQSSLKSFVEAKDVIIHLAACNKSNNINDILRVNVLGTKGLLDAIVRYAPNATLIFASSSQVYIKDSIYGRSKKDAEVMIEQYVRNQLIDKAIILRFTNLYGPGGKPFYNSVIATFAHLIKQNKEITVDGDGSQSRDFIYVEDAVEAISKAIKLDLKKNIEIIDICSGKQTSINEIVRLLAKYSDKKVVVKYKGISQVPEKIIKDFHRAKELLGWKQQTSLEPGLKKTMK